MTAHAHTHDHSPAIGWIESRLDRWAIGVSGLCAVHCVASTALLALASTAGGLLLNPLIHEIGLLIAVSVGIFALGRGVVRHGHMLPAAVASAGLGLMAGAATLPHDGGSETAWTLIGVAILALGHEFNRRASH